MLAVTIRKRASAMGRTIVTCVRSHIVRAVPMSTNTVRKDAITKIWAQNTSVAGFVVGSIKLADTIRVDTSAMIRAFRADVG